MNLILHNKYIGFNKLLIIAFALIYVFVSQDPNLKDQHELTQVLAKAFNSNFIHSHFSISQFITILIALMLLHKNQYNYFAAQFKRERTIFAFTLVYIGLLLINPNNSTITPILGLPLFSDISLYTSVLFMFSIFFMLNDLDFIESFKVIYRTIAVLYIVRIVILIIMWSLGNGVRFMGLNSVTMEEDTLIISVLFGLVFLALFYKTSKKKYLFLWFLFLCFQIISFRRSGLLLTIITNVAYLWLFYSKKNNIKRVLSIALIVSLFGYLLINFNVLPISAKIYLHRYVGEFVSLPESYAYSYFARNIHIEQSNESVLVAASGLPFWGFGFGDTQTRNRFNYEGNTGIHNAYFNLWEDQGLFALFYFLYFFAIIIKESISTIKNRKYYDKDYLLIRSAVLIFIFMFFINAYVLMMVNFTGLKMKIMLFFVIAFITKINNSNYKLLFGTYDKTMWRNNEKR
jgi:hypothetical protein